jgi:ADP-ribose pyrophosphatase
MSNSDARPWKATTIKTLTANPYFSVVLQNVVVPDGTAKTYYTIDFPRPSIGIVVRRGTDFLLLRQYRFIVDEHVWAIPSGGIEAGELPQEAAARELREETGLTASSLQPLMHCYASYGCSNQKFIIFLAEDLKPTASSYDENEVISWRWFSRDQVIEMILANGVVDNLSLSPLLLTLLKDSPEHRTSMKNPTGC